MPVQPGIGSPFSRWKHFRPCAHWPSSSHSPVQADKFLAFLSFVPDRIIGTVGTCELVRSVGNTIEYRSETLAYFVRGTFAYSNFTLIRLCAVRGSSVEVDFVALVEIASALLWFASCARLYVLDGFPIYSLPVQACAFGLCKGISGGTSASCRILQCHRERN